MKVKLGDLIEEYSERNVDNKYKPVAVGKYGIRAREGIYTKELAKDYSKNKLIYKGTLTVGMGSNQIDIGILRDDEIYSVSPAYHTYNIKISNYDYLDYLLTANNNRMFSIYANRGSRQGKTLDLKRWLTDELRLHDEKDQKIIVQTLNVVKQLISQKEAELVKLDNLIKARFVEMFSFVDSEQVKIAELVEQKIPTAKKDFEGDTEIKYIDISSIDNRRNIVTGSTKYKMSNAPSRAQQHVQFGDILISTVRPNLKNVAMVSLDNDNLVASSGFCVLRSKKCTPEFLMSIVCSDNFTNAMINVVTGANYPAIKNSDILNYYAPLPSEEQQKQFSNFVTQVDKSKFAAKQ